MSLTSTTEATSDLIGGGIRRATPHTYQAVCAAIGAFIVIYGAIFVYKPAFLFEPDGAMRQFGIGFRKKTFLPLWLLAILMAILLYLGALFLQGERT